MAPAAKSIPELEASTLDSEHHDEKAGVYELLCHVLQNGAIRRFRLQCDGVRQVRRRSERPRLEPWNYTEITEAYREPLADGGTLVSLDLWNEAEWIEVDCRSATVVEIGGSSKYPEHPARITWSHEQERIGLPSFGFTVDPAWIEPRVPMNPEGWSLVCRFEQPPNEQGNPSIAFVRFLVDNAPERLLNRGTKLRLFERGTMQFATVEILA